MTNEAGLEFDHFRDLTKMVGEPGDFVDTRLIAHEGGIQLYQAPEGAKITATTEHGGHLYVALHYGSGKNEIVVFNLNVASPAVPDIEPQRKAALDALKEIHSTAYNLPGNRQYEIILQFILGVGK